MESGGCDRAQHFDHVGDSRLYTQYIEPLQIEQMVKVYEGVPDVGFCTIRWEISHDTSYARTYGEET